MRALLALLVCLAALPAAGQTLVYSHHYCAPTGKIDIDMDGATITGERYRLRFAEDAIILTRKGKSERIQFYYGHNLDAPVIFRDRVYWPCGQDKGIYDPNNKLPEVPEVKIRLDR